MDDHAAILTIDRAALRANWRRLGARAGAAECGAVVKADAYGLGTGIVVPALAEAGCRTFFVAHLAEGIRVRAAARNATIYVLNGLAAGRLEDYRLHRLRPALGSIQEIEAWSQRGPGFEPAALQVDTAMNRLGIRLHEALALIGGAPLAARGIGMVLTHFASAEMPGAAETAEQIAAFAELARGLGAAEPPDQRPTLSLCNSSGLFLDGIATYDLARPGYALYGGNPVPARVNPMAPVVRLEAPIIQIAAIQTGETVGYNANFRAARATMIATVSCGYADGYPRNAGNNRRHPGGSAIVGGIECPFAGNVSMDLITLDITEVPPARVRPGDFVTLIGDTLDIDRVAAAGQTNGYEILTRLGPRYRRVATG